ncbi:GtrA family protein [Spirosoma rigui]|uniref:GtrA family protein n=1 Tax=Spirosoma rigui TaxID=564064 RepID=UPI0009AFA410|nr:GtrA family protein [Spirosoma rigui]
MFSGLPVFVRALLGSLLATGSDYSVSFGLHHWFRVSGVVATGLGASVGAVVGFVLSRYWVFPGQRRSRPQQAMRYGMVSLLGGTGNMAGMQLAELAHLPFSPARVGVGLLVYLFISYPINRRYVFS